MAALLSSVLDKTDDVVKYIGECRELHRHLPQVEEPLEVLPPDVNESGWKFTVVSEDQIRFGLGAVRGVGAGAVQSILHAREETGPFTSLFDFLERIDLRAPEQAGGGSPDRRRGPGRLRPPGPTPGGSGCGLLRGPGPAGGRGGRTGIPLRR